MRGVRGRPPASSEEHGQVPPVETINTTTVDPAPVSAGVGVLRHTDASACLGHLMCARVAPTFCRCFRSSRQGLAQRNMTLKRTRRLATRANRMKSSSRIRFTVQGGRNGARPLRPGIVACELTPEVPSKFGDMLGVVAGALTVELVHDRRVAKWHLEGGQHGQPRHADGYHPLTDVEAQCHTSLLCGCTASANLRASVMGRPRLWSRTRMSAVCMSNSGGIL